MILPVYDALIDDIMAQLAEAPVCDECRAALIAGAVESMPPELLRTALIESVADFVEFLIVDGQAGD